MRSKDTRHEEYVARLEQKNKNLERIIKELQADHRDREPTTDCCGAPFVHSDIDLCSKCYEHSSIHDIGFMDDPSHFEENNNDKET